ncbi:KAP family P-loop NTPase fold protein [Desulfocurvibacter africanus]|uniref:KAP family P-loop NTPase fold protein n=1 Tax=Desulfocurvibacter africanus TaxID=873 RepID=UPI0004068036|nr:P-loop NTPase fold protein [Desulfocurvibacter africanus]
MYSRLLKISLPSRVEFGFVCLTALGIFFVYLHFSRFVGFLVANRYHFYIAFSILLSALALYYFVKLAINLIRIRSKENQNNTNSFCLMDRPVEQLSDDEFERYSFANSLSKYLVSKRDTNSFVIALEDDWGSGKTSLINMTKQLIRSQYPRCIFININLWMASSLNSVFEVFLTEFEAALKRKKLNTNISSEVLDAFQEFSTAILKLKAGSIDGILKIGWDLLRGKSVLNDNTDIYQKKERLSCLLKSIDQPIVISIDDIERLFSSEVKVVFQLVKIICDFPQVSYLLAYDPKQTGILLKREGIKKPHEFLDKIIDLRLHLPAATYLQRKQFFKKSLDKLLHEYEIQLDDSEARLIGSSTVIASSMLSTPRKITKVLNRSIFIGMPLRGEVNIADIILMQVIQNEFPDLYNIIKSTPKLFCFDTKFTEVDNYTMNIGLESKKRYEQVNCLISPYLKSLIVLKRVN